MSEGNTMHRSREQFTLTLQSTCSTSHSPTWTVWKGTTFITIVLHRLVMKLRDLELNSPLQSLQSRPSSWSKLVLHKAIVNIIVHSNCPAIVSHLPAVFAQCCWHNVFLRTYTHRCTHNRCHRPSAQIRNLFMYCLIQKMLLWIIVSHDPEPLAQTLCSAHGLCWDQLWYQCHLA